MKFDHLVINVDKKYQTDKRIIEKIRKAKLPYEPKWGKGTSGFKASNLWIGNEYFEMIQILKPKGGGWKTDWTEMYNQGHRGLVCLMLDINNIGHLYDKIRQENIEITNPKWLEFKWFFNLLTRRMPWKNCYLPFFEGVPFQIGFQQMKDAEARKFMAAYMIPNSRDYGIDGIYNINIMGNYTEKDFKMILTVFGNHATMTKNTVEVVLSSNQSINFIKDKDYHIEIYTNSTESSYVEIENIKVIC